MLYPARDIDAAITGASDDLGRAEDAGHGKVVMLRDRIELVVVAAGTAHREPEKSAPEGIDLLIDGVEPQLFLVPLGQHLGAEGEKGRADELPAPGLVIGRGHEVAGDLLADEFVVGLVAVEGVDDVVPIPPGLVKGVVAVPAVRIGIAGHVEPVTTPFFAEGGPRKQFVDDTGERGR